MQYRKNGMSLQQESDIASGNTQLIVSFMVERGDAKDNTGAFWQSLQYLPSLDNSIPKFNKFTLTNILDESTSSNNDNVRNKENLCDLDRIVKKGIQMGMNKSFFIY